MFGWFHRSLEGRRAPDISGDMWFNVDSLPSTARDVAAAKEELRLAKDLKGYVTLIEFWTYSSRSCVSTLPSMHQIWETYRTQPFCLIGVHTPEFDFERDPEKVADALIRFNLSYPIVNDAEYQTWDRYRCKVWPRILLVDTRGKIRHDQEGEGRYEEIETKIQGLLKATG